jgi:hypothetical protein
MYTDYGFAYQFYRFRFARITIRSSMSNFIIGIKVEENTSL